MFYKKVKLLNKILRGVIAGRWQKSALVGFLLLTIIASPVIPSIALKSSNNEKLISVGTPAYAQTIIGTVPPQDSNNYLILSTISNDVSITAVVT